ncbi:MAG: DUF3846 domain-containing protein [Oscillospiraceae bacterium]|nr:DUF3846 domain-containing protein [Oscillospiraceae bacterium]MBQ9959244.1 DUF3846 domain-containing protein [Oscillospiraceae bacterium]
MERNEIITAMIVRPGEEPYISWLSNDLSALQGFVGGYIETVSLGQNLVMVCNEEGKLMGLPRSGFSWQGDPIVGNFFVCGCDWQTGELIGLCGKKRSEMDSEAVAKWLEVFAMYGLREEHA